MAQSDFLPASRPLLWDAKSCEEWLAKAALSEPRQACHEFTLLIEELEDAPPRHGAYLDILERLRKPLFAAQEEFAKKFAAKPLPLGHVEYAAFESSHDLWRAMLRARRRLLRAALNGRHPELVNHLPLLTERTLEAVGELLTTLWRARRETDAELWHELHELYSMAEARGFAARPLPGGTPAKPSMTCAGVYLRPILMQLAHPCGLTGREFQWMRRWAHRWAHKVRITTQPGNEGAYCLDLSNGSGAAWTATGGIAGSHRYLDTFELARSLKGRLKKLAEGAIPAELGLGSDCAQPSCSELLTQLVHAWIEAPVQPQFPRRAASGSASLTSGFAAIHFAVSGKPFPGGSQQWDYNRRDADYIQIFQQAPGAVQQGAERAMPLLEQWQIQDESATGFRLLRKGLGARLQHRQLVALRPQGASHFILAEVRWLTTGQDKSLAIGIKAIPGIARVCAVRAKNHPPQQEPFTQGFLLPVAPGLAPSLVLPAGWYQNGRELEMQANGETTRLSLFGLLARGYDYDRVNFSAIG